MNIINFLIKNYKTILSGVFGVYILYYLVFFLTPRIKMADEQKQKLESLNNMVQEIEKKQKKLDSNISNFNIKITEIDFNIDKLKGEKTIIREIYHEKISGIDKYSNPQLDSFFANRYNY
jgi:hypothetical protein